MSPKASSTGNEQPLIVLAGITKVFGTGAAAMQALRGIDLSIAAGEFVAIMGPSGSGKSTCMNILGCLDVPTSGSYRFEGIEVRTLERDQRALLRRHYLGFVFQGYNLLNRTSALENVELPLIYRGVPAANRHRRASEALADVGLTGWEDHTPGELSGGQQQRVAIARAIVTEPAVLLADAVAIDRDIVALAGVTASASQAVTAIFGNENWSTQITGVDAQWFKVRGWAIRIGREFLDTELRAGKAVCIVGATVRTKLFGGQEPLGNKIRLQKLACEVVGVLESKGQSTMGTDQDDLVLVPLRTFQRRIAGNQDVRLIQVSVQDADATEKAQLDIERLLRERRHIAGTRDDDFNVMVMKELARMLTGTTQILTALLGAVAGVSLLVGGIGIHKYHAGVGHRAHT